MKNYLFILVFSFLAVSCSKVEDTDDKGSLEFQVNDEAGLPVHGAKVTLHRDKQDWANWSNATDSAITDARGVVIFSPIQSLQYYFNVTIGERTNRYTVHNLADKARKLQVNKVNVVVRPYTEWEKYMGGTFHVAWKLLKLQTANGVPFFDYPVVTDMYLDGRWFDSNGRLGLWWFSPNEKKIFYDYAASGAVVTSDMIELTPDYFKAKIDFFGIVMIIEMIPE
jgi:hypothetical protein